jgi:EmrB/QacA subfamily drug resistance transporter
VVLCTAQFVLQLDFSIVNIALRTIQGELHFGAASLQWVVSGYALTFGSLLLLGGRLGDRLGRRRLLIWGLWLFGASSVACGLAQSPGMLVVARFVQGVGAAMMAPTILATLTSIYAEGHERTRALGIWTAATAAGGSTGIVLGGILTQYLGWRSIFLVNIPLIAILLVATKRVLPDLPGDRTEKLDILGAALVTFSLAFLIFGLTYGEQHGFGSTGSVASFALFVILGGAFIATELRVRVPMIAFSFFAVPVRRTSMIVMLIVGGTFASYAYFMALYLQRVLDFSEVQAAFALIPAPLTIFFGSALVTRRLIARWGIKLVMLGGLICMALGQLWFSRLSGSSDYWTSVLPPLVLNAFGGALIFPTVSIGITSNVPERDRGLAGGMVPTGQQVGSAIFLALLATIAASTTANQDSLIAGYRAAYLVAACCVAATALLVAFSNLNTAAPASEPAPAST